MLFAEIPGLESLKNTLRATIHNKHVAHAQLFIGNEGSANFAMALAYATFINCEDKTEEDACGRCPSCTQMAKLAHPDLHMVFPMASLEKVNKEDLKGHLLKHFRSFVTTQPYSTLQQWGTFIGAENKQFNIPVEEGRTIISNVSLKAYQSEYKIVLIWMPELMHISTANSILKVLEEPPAKTLFFLVANDYERLLSTILSRCQLVKVRSFEDEEVTAFLTEKNLAGEKEARQIAKISEGNLSKALVLTQSSEHDNHALFAAWMRLNYGRKYADLLAFSEDLSKKGREYQKNLLLYSIQILRDVLMSKLGLDELIKQTEEETVFIKNFAKPLQQEVIEKIYNLLSEAFQHIERNGNPKIIFFDTSIKISVLFERKPATS